MTNPQATIPTDTTGDTRRRVSNLAWWANNTGFVAAALTACAALLGIASWVLSGWLSEAKDAEIARFQSESKTATSVADARAAEANARASEAAERVSSLELQVAAQQERAARAEAELLERIRPRHLTVDQRDQLIARLSTKPKGFAHVQCPSNDGEACVFAEELQGVLNDAGWKTDFVHAVLIRVPTGVQVSQQSEGDGRPEMNALFAALRAFGVDTSAVFDPDLPAADHIRLLVGRKP